MLRTSLLVALATCCGVGPAFAWLTATNGVGPAASDRAAAVAVDGAGDVLAAGSTGSAVGDVFTVVKHRGSDGAVVWKRLLSGTGDGSGYALAVAVDGTDAVVAAGSLHGAGTTDDFAVVKFDAAGTEVWRHVIDGDAHMFDAASAVAVDAAGNVVAAGYLRQSTSYDIFVIAWNVAGVEQWRAFVDGVTMGSFDDASGVTFDRAGNVVVAGTTDGRADMVVAKLDSTGFELWRRKVRGTDTMFLFQDVADVRTDSQNHVVVAGALNNVATGFDFTVIAWDPLGTERWRRSINGAIGDSSDSATALAIDAEDAVVAVGFTQNETTTDWTAAKWTASGAEVWRRVLVGDPELANAIPAAVTTDAAGAVIAAGSVRSEVTGFSDLVAIKSASDGPELWRSVLDGSATDEAVQSEATEGWVGVALDAAGHVVVAGLTIEDGTEDDFTVAKLDGATGGLTICGNAVVEPGEACDPGSDVAGDCCTAACGLIGDAEPCEDGDSDACTAPDTCAAGICRSGARSCRLGVPDDPIPVAVDKPIVPLDCEASPGAVCKAVLLESPTAITSRMAAAAATGPRPLSRKTRVRIKSNGHAALKLKLNQRGRKLLQGAGDAPVRVLVQATIRDGSTTRRLEKALLLRRR